MANGVHATDLNRALDVTQGARRDANNLALADQIQFSSILRMLVDTPEQALEAAQAATQSSETEESRPEAPEREARPARRAERRRDDARDGDHGPRVREPRPERVDAATLRPPVPAQDSGAASPAFDIAGTQVPIVDQLIADPSQAKRVGLETPREPRAVAAQVASPAAELAPAEAPVIAAKSQALLDHAAQSIASSALTDRQFSRVGEDLHDAVMHKFARVSQRAGTQTAANSLKQEQETDLSSRLGLTTPVVIQVDAANERAQLRSNPLHSLTGGAAMTDLQGLDSEPHPFAQSFKNPGDSFGAEQKAPTHGNLLAERGPTAQNPGDSTFSQALRAQGALIAAQQSAQTGGDAKPLLPSEVNQITGAAAPSGPSQVSQSAKANPTTAARQPERPQAPAEQIAVKIRQAVGDGVDKINIKLNPATLGRVEVRLEIKDGHIAATVLAERQETLDMLQKDARGLERALLDAGLRTDVQSLSFGLRSDGQRHVDTGRERRPGGSARPSERMDAGERGDDGIVGKSQAYGKNLRLNGGVDIRV